MSNIYTQTNEIENKIINFKQSADGTLTEFSALQQGDAAPTGSRR
jgi:hypothetical protein